MQNYFWNYFWHGICCSLQKNFFIFLKSTHMGGHRAGPVPPFGGCLPPQQDPPLSGGQSEKNFFVFRPAPSVRGRSPVPRSPRGTPVGGCRCSPPQRSVPTPCTPTSPPRWGYTLRSVGHHACTSPFRTSKEGGWTGHPTPNPTFGGHSAEIVSSVSI